MAEKLKTIWRWFTTSDKRAEIRGHMRAAREAEHRAWEARTKADGQVLSMMVEYYEQMAELAAQEAAYHQQLAKVSTVEQQIALRRAFLVVLP